MEGGKDTTNKKDFVINNRRITNPFIRIVASLSLILGSVWTGACNADLNPDQAGRATAVAINNDPILLEATYSSWPTEAREVIQNRSTSFMCSGTYPKKDGGPGFEVRTEVGMGLWLGGNFFVTVSHIVPIDSAESFLETQIPGTIFLRFSSNKPEGVKIYRNYVNDIALIYFTENAPYYPQLEPLTFSTAQPEAGTQLYTRSFPGIDPGGFTNPLEAPLTVTVIDNPTSEEITSNPLYLAAIGPGIGGQSGSPGLTYEDGKALVSGLYRGYDPRTNPDELCFVSISALIELLKEAQKDFPNDPTILESLKALGVSSP